MVSVLSRPKARAIAPVIASAGALALLLTGCGAGGGSSASGSKDFGYLTNVENTTIRGELEALSKDQCKAENAAAPLKIETVPQTSLDQKLQLLAGQDALPAAVRGRQRPGPDAGPGQVRKRAGLRKGAQGPEHLRRHPSGSGGHHQVPVRREAERSAVPVQRRGHLVQQEDLRRERHYRAEDLGRLRGRRPTSSRPPASRRSPHPASRAGPSPAWSAATCSATSAPTP